VKSLAAPSVGSPENPGWLAIEQREKSWYFDYFLKGGRGGEGLRANDWALFRALNRGQGDQDRYARDLARPGALTAGLNWYRANLRDPADADRDRDRSEAAAPGPLRQPVLGVRSDGDPFLLEPQMAASRSVVVEPWRYERVEGAGHWLMLDRPEEVNRLLIDFLLEVETPGAK
jgi:pimeloyl-ACP methyl ester carboxylesterase